MRSIYEFYNDCRGEHPSKIYVDYEEHAEEEAADPTYFSVGWEDICMDSARNYIRANWSFPDWNQRDWGPAPKFKDVMLDFWIHDFVAPFLKMAEDPRQDLMTREKRDALVEILYPNNEKVKTKEEEA